MTPDSELSERPGGKLSGLPRDQAAQLLRRDGIEEAVRQLGMTTETFSPRPVTGFRHELRTAIRGHE